MSSEVTEPSTSSTQGKTTAMATSTSGSGGISWNSGKSAAKTIRIGGKTVTNTTLKFTGEGFTGIKVGGSPSSSIKIGGESSMGSNLIMSKAGPVEVTPRPPSSSVSSSTFSSVADSSVKGEEGSRTPVFAQILANLRQQGGSIGSAVKRVISPATSKPPAAVSSSRKSPQFVPKSSSFTSPLVLSRQRDPAAMLAPVASIPKASYPEQVTPNTTAIPTASKRTAAKHHRAQLSQTLVEQEDMEPMDVDVGKPFQLLELPRHLRDHSYSCYNPEEGERLVTGTSRPKSFRVSSSIPPARVSYAPQVSINVYCVYCVCCMHMCMSMHMHVSGSHRWAYASWCCMQLTNAVYLCVYDYITYVSMYIMYVCVCV